MQDNVGKAVMVTNRVVTEDAEITVYRDDGGVSRMRDVHSVYLSDENVVDEQCQVDVMLKVAKAVSDEGLVSGWANVAVNADGSLPLDWQDDIIQPQMLEKAAINFMQEYRDSGTMHEGASIGTVVESIVFTKDKQACLGIPEGVLPEGWFITVKVHDPEAFEKVKNGTFKMFSIQGHAKRVKL